MLKKFKPMITRIKLNPEQAVLSCDCYLDGYRWASGSDRGSVIRSLCVSRGSYGGYRYECGHGDPTYAGTDGRSSSGKS